MYLMKKKKSNKTHLEDMNYDEWCNSQAVYWRKANEIHKWFVDNVQNGIDDCAYYPVSKEKIEELKAICIKVLQNVVVGPGKVILGEKYNKETDKFEPFYENGNVVLNPELCEELLPTQRGYFFGGTGYDEYYLRDLESTVKEFDRILEEIDFDNEQLYYHSSW